FDVATTGTLNLARLTLEKGHSGTTPGGAIANHGMLNLSNVTMRLNINDATVDGGAIFTDGRNTKIDGCLFDNNAAASGGAIAMANGAVSAGIQISNGQFTSNSARGPASGFGGAIFAAGLYIGFSGAVFFTYEGRFGGALHVRSNDASSATATIDKVSFLANSSGSMGGAVYLRGTDASVTITGSAFESNAAADGGGG